MQTKLLASYLGPNLYAPVAGIRLRLKLGDIAASSCKSLGDDFILRVLDTFPVFHTTSSTDTPPFADRLKEGCELAELVEQITLSLLDMAGISTSHTRLVRRNKPGSYNFFIASAEIETGILAARLAWYLVVYLLPDPVQVADDLPSGFRPDAATKHFLAQAEDRALGEITRAQVEMAEARDIPWFRLNPAARVVQLGHGKNRHLFLASLTMETSYVSCMINRNKTVALDILRSMGLPVPRHIPVSNETQARAAADKIGFPAVIKPQSGHRGEGITVGVEDAGALTKAFSLAVQFDKNVLVEEFIPGDDHRILVVNNTVVAVAQRRPAQVVGDGEHSVRELVAILNAQQGRKRGSQYALEQIELDSRADEILHQRGYGTDSVLAAGEVVALTGTANMSTGGTAVDYTEHIHPDNARLATRAVRIIGLNIAGVDFITPDISRSWLETGGAICEVNDSVGLRPHLQANPDRDVIAPIISAMMPPGTTGRIPIAAITGTSGKTTTAVMVARILQTAGHAVGLATTNGAFINGERIRKGDLAGGPAARALLMDPDIDAAVFETARGGLIKSGISYGQCDVGAVLNVANDHLGEHGIETPEDLARVKALVANSAREWVVLNADDALCVAMAADAPAKHVCLVSCDRNNPLIAEHVAAAGRAVIIDFDRPGMPISALESGVELPVVNACDVPATFEGSARFNCINALFAVAIGYCMNQSPDCIQQALLGFTSSYEDVPGRANVYDRHPFTVVLDHAHNPHKLAALTDWMRARYVDRRRLLVMTSPGNRRDTLYAEMAATAAGHYDRFICSRWGDNPRGRGPLEVQKFLQKGLIASGVDADSIRVAETENDAISKVLDMAEPGDVVAICCKNVDEAWQQVKTYQSQFE